MATNFHFGTWIEAFTINASRIDAIPWDEAYALDSRERKTIFDSIRRFQRGESGEGKYLFREAQKYTGQCGDDSYLAALKLFICEENRHAQYLLDFMKAHTIQKIDDHWVDNVFRWLRHHGNLEVSVRVLVTAEYIAAVYYKALMRATGSKCLAEISQRILEDEDIHIRFQSQALQYFEHGRTASLNKSIQFAHQILFCGTILVVWHSHRKVLKAGGYNLRRFVAECLAVYVGSQREGASKKIQDNKNRKLSPAAL